MQCMAVIAEVTVYPASLVRSVHLSPHERTVDDVVVPFDKQWRSIALNRDLLRHRRRELVVGIERPVVPRCKLRDKFRIIALRHLPGKRN